MELMHRPTVCTLLPMRQLLPYLPKIGSAAFRRFLLKLIPRPDLLKMISIVDTLYSTSKGVFHGKKAALAEGKDVTAQDVDGRKDLISVLCKSHCLYSQCPETRMDNESCSPVKANETASEDDRLTDEEVLAQMS